MFQTLTQLWYRIAALDIKDTSEVNWKSLATGELCLWSGHVLQRRFRTMKRAIKGYEAMKFKGSFMLFFHKRKSSHIRASRDHRNSPPEEC